MDSERSKEPTIEELISLIKARGQRSPAIQELNPELRTTKYATPGMNVADVDAYFVRPRKST